jgi:hypothetical protein
LPDLGGRPLPGATPPPSRSPVLLLAPVPLPAGPAGRETSPTAPAAGPAPSLAGAIEKARQADARFGTIITEVQGGTVLLRGGGVPDDHVMAFAQALTHVPGVERVVVQNAPPQ